MTAREKSAPPARETRSVQDRPGRDGPEGRNGPILVALGANLPSRVGAPRETLEAALAALETEGVGVVARSAWYESAPVPPSGQPLYVNGVAEVTTGRSPEALLGLMQRLEVAFGREEGPRNAARCIDLDLIAYGDRRMDGASGVVLPHPRLRERAFVLRPLLDVCPAWRHPVTGESARDLLARVEAAQPLRRLT